MKMGHFLESANADSDARMIARDSDWHCIPAVVWTFHLGSKQGYPGSSFPGQEQRPSPLSVWSYFLFPHLGDRLLQRSPRVLKYQMTFRCFCQENGGATGVIDARSENGASNRWRLGFVPRGMSGKSGVCTEEWRGWQKSVAMVQIEN